MAAKFRIVLDSPTAVPGGFLSGRILATDVMPAKPITLTLSASNDEPGRVTRCEYGQTKHQTVNLERPLEPGEWVPFFFFVPLDLVPSVKTDRVNLRWELVGLLRDRFFQVQVVSDVQILPPGSDVPVEQRVTEKTLRQFRRREFYLGGWSDKQKRLKKVQVALSSVLVRAGSDVEVHVRNAGVEACTIGLLCHERTGESGEDVKLEVVHSLIFESWEPLPLGDSVVLLAVPPAGPPSYSFGVAGVRWEVRVSVADSEDLWETEGPVQEAIVLL